MNLNLSTLRATLAACMVSIFAFSCSEDVTLDQYSDSNGRELITFTANTDGDTRGSIISSADFTSFTLYAYEEGVSAPFINGATFTLTNGTWSSTDSYYWPSDSSTSIEFFAYTPAGAGADNGISFNRGVLTYNMVGVDNANLPDITVAYQKQSAGSVSLSFSRMVAILQFKASGESQGIESVTIEGFSEYGMCTIAATPGWSNLDIINGGKYEAGLETIDENEGGAAINITKSTGYIMVIPQEATGVKIIAKNAADSKEYTINPTWAAGTLYSYTIDSDDITVVLTNPNHDPSNGLFDLDEYENTYDGKAEFEADVEAADANGVTSYVITGEYSGEDMIFGSGNIFADIETAGVVVDFSGVTNFPTELPSQALYANSTATPGVVEFIFPVTDAESETNGISISVGSSAFSNTNITTITIPEVGMIGNYAFNGCDALAYVELPDATILGSNVFKNCSALTTLKLTASGEFTLNSSVFDNFDTTACDLYLHIDQKDNVVKMDDEGSYVGAVWGGVVWKEVHFVDDSGAEVDPDAGVLVASSDYTNSEFGSSNCYMLHPSSEGYMEYYIPVEARINQFWGGGDYEDNSDYTLSAGDEWTTKILWGDVDEFTGFTAERVTSGFNVTSTCTSAMKVHVPTGFNHGNIVVAVMKEEVVIWSWHFWITDYNPDEACDTSVSSTTNSYTELTTTVTGGRVHRYVDGDDYLTPPFSSITFDVWGGYNDGIYYSKTIHIMDRFLGATASGHSGAGTYKTGDGYDDYPLQRQGALYYQFGRKDPFPGSCGKYATGLTYEPSTTRVYAASTMAYTVNNPIAYIAPSSGGDWTSDTKYNNTSTFWHDPSFTASTKSYSNNMYGSYIYPIDTRSNSSFTYNKSIFDPCPLGWRMPDWRTWSDFYYFYSYTPVITAAYLTAWFADSSGASIYYISSGYRDASTGTLMGGGTCMWTWSNFSEFSLYAPEISGSNNYVNSFKTGTTTSTGLPVRPVRQW